MYFLRWFFFNEKFKTLIDFYSLKYLFLYVYNLHNRDLKWFYFCLFLFCCIFRVLLIFISKDYWNRIYIECHNFESHKIQCVQCTSIPWIPLVYFFVLNFCFIIKEFSRIYRWKTQNEDQAAQWQCSKHLQFTDVRAMHADWILLGTSSKTMNDKSQVKVSMKKKPKQELKQKNKI